MYVLIPAKPTTANPTKAIVSTGPEDVVDAVVPVDVVPVEVVPVVSVVEVVDVVVSVVGSSGGRDGRAGGESAARVGEANSRNTIDNMIVAHFIFVFIFPL